MLVYLLVNITQPFNKIITKTDKTASGSGQVAIGSGQVASGSGQVAIGSGQAASGSGQAAIGSGKQLFTTYQGCHAPAGSAIQTALDRVVTAWKIYFPKKILPIQPY